MGAEAYLQSLASKFGMAWSIAEIILHKRLQWLGHLGRMEDDRLPKKVLFGEMRKKRACHGPKKRWRDQMSGDLLALTLRQLVVLKMSLFPFKLRVPS